MPEISQPTGTVTLTGLAASGAPEPCPCSLLGATESALTLGLWNGCGTCDSPTTPSASGSFFTNPLGGVSDAAGNVLDSAGQAAKDAGNAAAKAAHAATLPVVAASLAIILVAFAAIHVANRI